MVAGLLGPAANAGLPALSRAGIYSIAFTRPGPGVDPSCMLPMCTAHPVGISMCAKMQSLAAPSALPALSRAGRHADQPADVAASPQHQAEQEGAPAAGHWVHLRQSPQLSAVNSGGPRPAHGGDAFALPLPTLPASDVAVAAPPPARSSAGPSRSMAADTAARDSPQEVEAAAGDAAGGAAADGAAQLLEGTAAAEHELTAGPAEAQRLHGVPGDVADKAAEGPPRRQGRRCGLAGWTVRCAAACQGVLCILIHQ